MSRREKKFVVPILLATTLALAGGGALYYGVRRSQRHAAAEMILNLDKAYSPGSRIGSPSAIPESKRRGIFELAIIAAEKNVALEESERFDSGKAVVYRPDRGPAALAASIQRIALGNAVTEDEVFQIVREGSTNDW